MRLSVLFLLAACGSDQSTVDAPPVVDASLAPSLSAVANPTTIAAGGTVVLGVTTSNFTVISPNVAVGIKPGEGHYHYYLDDAANYIAAWTPTVGVRTAANAAPGLHMIRVVLVTSAHVEITPLVETTVTFTVQ